MSFGCIDSLTKAHEDRACACSDELLCSGRRACWRRACNDSTVSVAVTRFGELPMSPFPGSGMSRYRTECFPRDSRAGRIRPFG